MNSRLQTIDRLVFLSRNMNLHTDINMDRQLSIGELSRVSGLSVKAIRFYHEQSLLVPACVDPESGYRYYDAANVETARVIVVLRELQFSIDQIRTILADGETSNLVEILEQQKSELHAKIRAQRQVMDRIQQAINFEQENLAMQEQARVEVEERQLEPLLVVGVRMKGRYDEMGTAFAKLGKSFGSKISGKAMCLYYDDEFREDDADFEPCFPIRKAPARVSEEFSARELPGGRAVCLQYVGPYTQIGRAYESLFRYANENGLTRSIPSREVYLKGPGMIFRGNPKQYVTEVQFLVDQV